jgi:hypothetical protein
LALLLPRIDDLASLHVGRGRIGDRLQLDSIAQTFKRVAKFVGMTTDDAKGVSGHSIRVGATQDMLALNIDLAFVMQARTWHPLPITGILWHPLCPKP